MTEASVPPFVRDGTGRGEERQPGAPMDGTEHAQGGVPASPHFPLSPPHAPLPDTIARICDLAAKERCSKVDMALVADAFRRRVDQVRLHKALSIGQSLLIAAEREEQQRGAVALTMRALKLTEDKAAYCVLLAVAEMRGQLLVERGSAPLTLVQAEIAAGVRDACGMPRAEFARCVVDGSGGGE